MDRQTLTDLREQSHALAVKMRGLLDKAEGESRDLSGEEAQEFDRVEAEHDALNARIARGEKVLGLESRGGREVLPSEPPKDEAADVRAGGLPKSEEYRDAFAQLVRSAGRMDALSAEQRVALAVGVDANGGALVPDQFYKVLFESAEEFSFMRQYGTIVPTGEHGDLIIPRRGARSAAVWLAEGAAYTESEPDFGQSILKALKVGLYSKASDEMVDDPFFDVLSFLAKQAGEAIGIAANAAYVNGAAASTTTPKGIVNRATVGVTLATGQTTTITSADSLIDLQHSVISPYRANARWLLHDSTLKLVRKLKTTDNQYIWQPGIQAGVPSTLLGNEVLTDPNMPVPAANAKTVVYGDLKSYWIRDVQELRIKPLTELFALNGQVGIRASARTDGDLVDTAAVRVLAQSAT